MNGWMSGGRQGPHLIRLFMIKFVSSRVPFQTVGVMRNGLASESGQGSHSPSFDDFFGLLHV